MMRTMDTASTIPAVKTQAPCCIRCGYDLRGLAEDGRCPECGENIGVSLPGRLLAVADKGWVRSILWGAVLSGATLPLMYAVAFAAQYIWGDFGVPLALFPAIVFAFGGLPLWRVTRPEPGGPYFDDCRWLRLLTRSVAVVAGLASVALGLLDVWNSSGVKIGGLSSDAIQSWLGFPVFIFGGLAMFVLLPRHLAILARRLPSPTLSRLGNLAMLSFPVAVAIEVSLSVLLRYLYRFSAILDFCAVAIGFLAGIYSIVWAICVHRRLKSAPRMSR